MTAIPAPDKVAAVAAAESLMQLIGVNRSPYTRRVAITLRAYGIDFEQRQISGFGNREEVRASNPLGRIPALVLDVVWTRFDPWQSSVLQHTGPALTEQQIPDSPTAFSSPDGSALIRWLVGAGGWSQSRSAPTGRRDCGAPFVPWLRGCFRG